MGSRERKRAERHKRKRRKAADRPVETEAPTAAPANGDPAAAAEPESFQARMAQRSEERNAAVRAELEPLADGERPGAVTVGAVVSAVLALIFTGSAIVAATGSVEISGEEPSPVGIALFAAGLWAMTWGMWKARYWAVLGFQVLLLIVLVLVALGMVSIATIPQLIASLLLLGGSGTLFYFMIRAMARIQMPDRPGER
jgi:hypothetical protein